MNKLTSFLIDEQQAHRKGGLYHRTQVQLAYNSNRIEGSKLTEEQTRYIFETRTIGFKDQEAVPVDDIIETANHFAKAHQKEQEIIWYQAVYIQVVSMRCHSLLSCISSC